MFEAWAQWRMWNHCHNHYTVNQKQKTNVDRDKTLQFVFPKAQNAVFFSRGLRCSHHWNFEIIVTIITHSIWGIPTTNKVKSISHSTNPTKKNTRDLILLQKPHILPFPKGGAPAIFFKQGLRYSNNQQTTRCSQYHTLNKLNQQKASDRRVLQHPHNLPFPKGGAPAIFFFKQGLKYSNN